MIRKAISHFQFWSAYRQWPCLRSSLWATVGNKACYPTRCSQEEKGSMVKYFCEMLPTSPTLSEEHNSLQCTEGSEKFHKKLAGSTQQGKIVFAHQTLSPCLHSFIHYTVVKHLLCDMHCILLNKMDMASVFVNFIKQMERSPTPRRASAYMGNDYYYETYGLTSVFITNYCT